MQSLNESTTCCHQRTVVQTWQQENIISKHTCQEAQEILHSDFIPSVVNLYVVPIHIQLVTLIAEEGSWEGVARVAGVVICQHQEDVGVWQTHPPDCPVD
jgi:hypothetical protein